MSLAERAAPWCRMSPPSVGGQDRWKYEPDEIPKKKHHWDLDSPGFVVVGGMEVGKCPSGLSLHKAEEILATGIEFFPVGHRHSWPKRIDVVHEGAVYRAVPTNPGVSYHGFPELPK